MYEASVCSHMHLSRIRIHPYASRHFHYAAKCQYPTHLFAEQTKQFKELSKSQIYACEQERKIGPDPTRCSKSAKHVAYIISHQINFVPQNN